MICECNIKDLYEGNEAVLFERKFLQVVRVDAYKWKTLFKCKSCNQYWEEVYIDGRFGGTPELRKVDESYAMSAWGLDSI